MWQEHSAFPIHRWKKLAEQRFHIKTKYSDQIVLSSPNPQVPSLLLSPVLWAPTGCNMVTAKGRSWGSWHHPTPKNLSSAPCEQAATAQSKVSHSHRAGGPQAPRAVRKH